MVTKEYTITLGENKIKRKVHDEKSFNTFKNLVDFLENSKKSLLANDYNKSKSSWISSEQCESKKEFKQDYFKANGKICILDFDGELTVKDCESKLKGLNYYIYNSTNNGKNGAEKFRVIIPLSRVLLSMEEVKTFYKSINVYFDNKADKACLTACWVMYAPQNWISTKKGKKFNSKVKELNITNFEGKELDVDYILNEYKVEEKKYSQSEPNEIAKIDFSKQIKFMIDYINEFKLVPAGKGLRHSSFYKLAVRLKSLGFTDNVINKKLQELNYKLTNNNIESFMNSLSKKTYKIDPSVFQDEYFLSYLLNNQEQSLSKNTIKIEITENEKISDLTEFKNKDLFSSEGINLLCSPTNSGKSYYVLNEYINCINDSDYIVLLVPYVSILMDFSSDDVYTIYGSEKFDEKIAKEKRIVVSSYDKFVNGFHYSIDLAKTHIFIDEAHNLYTSFNYRHETLNKLYDILINHQPYKKLILMSGTFELNYFEDNFISNKIEVTRNIEKTKNCKVLYINNNLSDSVCENVIGNYNYCNNSTQIIYVNDKSKGEKISKALDEKNITTALLNTDTKESKTSQEIFRNNKIPDDVAVLIMTKIGEEGLSFTNHIHSIHCIGKIDSSSAEQLGNRARKNTPEMLIYTSENKDKEYVLRKKFSEINYLYETKTKIIDVDIKENILHYKHRMSESFKDFIIWDECSEQAEYIPLIVSFDLYKTEVINEFNFYETYFKQKMESFGWSVEFIRLDVTDIPSIASNQGEKVVDYKKIIQEFKLNVAFSLKNIINHKKVEDFLYHYSNLSMYYSDKEILQAIETSNRNFNRIEGLLTLINIEKNGMDRIQKWIYNNIKVGDEYNKENSEKKLDDLLTQLQKYDPREEKISKHKFNKVLDTYFIIEKQNRKIKGKSQQVIKVLERKSIPIKKEIDKNHLQEEIFNTERYIDTLAQEYDQEEQISLKDYNELLDTHLDNMYRLNLSAA